MRDDGILSLRGARGTTPDNIRVPCHVIVWSEARPWQSQGSEAETCNSKTESQSRWSLMGLRRRVLRTLLVMTNM